jgi:cytochrome c-type biogenesis protein CcmF
VFILAFLVVVIGASLALFAWRAPKIGLGGKFDTVSRESALLLNNILLASACAAVLLGTMYPLFLDALGLGKLSVGPPYFNAVFVPIMAPLVFLMGIGPIARWKKAELPDLATRLRWALGVAFVAAMAAPFIAGNWTPMIAFGLFLAFWLIASIVVGVRERIRYVRGGILERLAAQGRAYWGMQLAHLGVAVFIIGVTMVKGYEVERDVKMDVGDTVAIGSYVFKFEGTREVAGPNYRGARGSLEVTKDGKFVERLHPEKRIYNVQQMPMTESAISTGVFGDRYVSLGEPVGGNAWVVRVYSKPFIVWIWGGCVLMALGGLVALADRRYRLLARRDQAALGGKAAAA